MCLIIEVEPEAVSINVTITFEPLANICFRRDGSTVFFGQRLEEVPGGAWAHHLAASLLRRVEHGPVLVIVPPLLLCRTFTQVLSTPNELVSGFACGCSATLEAIWQGAPLAVYAFDILDLGEAELIAEDLLARGPTGYGVVLIGLVRASDEGEPAVKGTRLQHVFVN